MSSPKDMKTAKEYTVSFSSRPDEADLAEFKAKWVSALGVVRERTRAGRIWIGIPDGKGGTCSVISFWGPRRSIKRSDIDAVASVFKVKGRLLVEFIDSVAPGRYLIPSRRS